MAYLGAHVWLALAQPTLEGGVSMAFHFVLLVGGFSLWSVLRANEMALWLARLFLASEVAACGMVLAQRVGDARPEGSDDAPMISLPGVLVASSVQLLAVLALVPVTLEAESNFLSFDEEAPSLHGATRAPPSFRHKAII